MKKVKITVLKTTLDKELAAEYGVPGLKACPMLREGQTFLADYAKPDGLYDEAWKAIYQYVFALAHREPGDGSLFYYGDWIRKPAWPFAVATTACAPSFSSWRPPARTLRPNIRPFADSGR